MFGVALAHDAANFGATRYRAVEGARDERITVVRGTHGYGSSSVGVAVTADTAQAGFDFTASHVRVTFDSPVDEQETFVGLLDDADVEPLETVSLDLHDPSRGMVVAFPNHSEMTLIDDDGAARFDVESPELSVFETARTADVWVIRSGDATEAASVDYTTAEGTAEGGVDYRATGGTLQFAAGERAQKIAVPLKDNDLPDGNRAFSVELSSPAGAALTESSTSTVTLLDDESDGSGDQVPPYTAFHKPLHGKTYGSKSFDEAFVFMQDNPGGAGIETVRLAIRKKRTDGGCAWLRPKGFRPGSCRDIRWSGQEPGLYTDVALFDLDVRLTPSTKARGIRHYTAFSQGIDRVGNIQTTLDQGQNKNDFEIK